MFKKTLSTTLMISLAFTTSLLTSANAKPISNQGNAQVNSIKQFITTSPSQIKIYSHVSNGHQVFAAGKLSTPLSVNPSTALTFLESHKSLFGLTSSTKSFKVVHFEKDSLGDTVVKVNQLLQGLPVRGQELILHFDSSGVIKNITGSVENQITEITSFGNQNISTSKALTIAQKQFIHQGLRTQPTAEKQVIIHNGKAYEVYKVNIQYLQPTIGNWDVYIEVSSGKVLEKVSNIRYDGPTTGTGTAVDGTTLPLNLYLSGTSYQMIDATKAMTGQIKTYTAANKQVEPGTLIANPTDTFTTDTLKSGVSAHYNAGTVYDFYKNLFNRNSMDNNGMSIISTVHYGSNYNNAFWDGTQMVYGDGDGTTFTYLSGDLDVVAHELTHGVTEKTANLTYSNQSGALNESMSDVFGVLVETYNKYNVKNGGTWSFNSSDWVVGDDIYTPATPGDALRSLANPTLYNQPDNMANFVTTTTDNGGVHTNSGIPNKAAYLIAQSIGADKTAPIYYRALTTYLTASSDFLAARLALVSAATDLYGDSSAEVTAVNTAFNAVGVIVINDSYEPNNTSAQAFPITSGTTYSSYIASSSDLDYYKISATSGKAITISLTNLPKDYDLYLYKNTGTLVASSAKSGTTSESITYTAKYTGDYYILVKGYGGAYSTTTKYNLIANY